MALVFASSFVKEKQHFSMHQELWFQKPAQQYYFASQQLVEFKVFSFCHQKQQSISTVSAALLEASTISCSLRANLAQKHVNNKKRSNKTETSFEYDKCARIIRRIPSTSILAKLNTYKARLISLHFYILSQHISYIQSSTLLCPIAIYFSFLPNVIWNVGLMHISFSKFVFMIMESKKVLFH